MSEGKPSTPVTSPKMSKSFRFSSPTTPPSKHRPKRNSATMLLKTPEQQQEHLTLSPLKRPNGLNLKSPEFGLNISSGQSPYSTMKTPQQSGYDSDDGGSEARKFQKTPQYFSPGRKLFSEELGSKEELSEISSQLKSRLSSALGKVQKQQHQDDKDKLPGKLDFTDLSFTSTSPTKKNLPGRERWSMINTYSPVNLNLQTLEKSPALNSSSSFSQPVTSPEHSTQYLKTSPMFTGDHESHVDLSSIGEEESSAHNALMAALSRQRRYRTFHSRRRSLNLVPGDPPKVLQPPLHPPVLQPSQQSYQPPSLSLHDEGMHRKAPSLSGNSDSPRNEQDAVLSLMSLSSPQSVSFSHRRTQSLNSISHSSKSPSSVNASPTKKTNDPNDRMELPPISGIFDTKGKVAPSSSQSKVDDDETDVEDETDVDQESQEKDDDMNDDDNDDDSGDKEQSKASSDNE
ncbi:Piso0_004209 [Millerozyma farinosa CBS 7064]|uniref:Piso0_004209 protein n=1 Tax=Pichia sorbitophila (strain ATCC MYA-4447 / BCRC 22081 / CBS 7064 / NBRC 10061 / NRRL Y-12695) TaxID=559304 RepID=G8Y7S6_PICSO|nr:Piso0_004209 [Millerozyma farinosa CBS 7064]CCE84656.1 Piso0_004209 [Millerozyma farinosa CBS 7064]